MQVLLQSEFPQRSTIHSYTGIEVPKHDVRVMHQKFHFNLCNGKQRIQVTSWASVCIVCINYWPARSCQNAADSTQTHTHHSWSPGARRWWASTWVKSSASSWVAVSELYSSSQYDDPSQRHCVARPVLNQWHASISKVWYSPQMKPTAPLRLIHPSSI